MLRPSQQVNGTDESGYGTRVSVPLSGIRVDVLGMIGHDVAAALTVIMAYSESALMLLDQRADSPAHNVDLAAVRQKIEAVLRHAYRLESIRKDLLATAAADSGAVCAVASAVRLLPFLRAWADLAPAHLAMTIDCDSDVSCAVQPSHLSQMVSNLVSNAVRYADSQVMLSASQVEDRVLITVTDDGPGLSPDMMGRLFTRFSHAGASSRPVGAGSGLGLYIVRTLADANHGTVRYSPGESGARFTLALPAAATLHDRFRAQPPEGMPQQR